MLGSGCCAPKLQKHWKQWESNTKSIRGGGFKFASGMACKMLKRRQVIPRVQRKFAASGAHIKSATRGAAKEHRVEPAMCGVTMMKDPWNTSVLSPHAAASLAMVGSAQESDIIHAKRHPLAQVEKWAKDCARCAFILWKQNRKARSQCDWIAAKPPFMGGAWGLGCTWCAAAKTSPVVQQCRRMHMQANKAAGRAKQAISRSSAWSCYEQRQLWSARTLNERIAEHETGDLHRLSQKIFFSPHGHLQNFLHPRGHAALRIARGTYSLSLLPGTLATAKDAGGAQPVANPVQSRLVAASAQPFATRVGSASDPFRGWVPQCQDWVDVWVDTTSVISMQGPVYFKCRGIWIGNAFRN